MAEQKIINLAGCTAAGVGGFHTDSYADPDDGVCKACGLKAMKVHFEDGELYELLHLFEQCAASIRSVGRDPPNWSDEVTKKLIEISKLLHKVGICEVR